MTDLPRRIIPVLLLLTAALPGGAAPEPALVIRPGEYTEFIAPLSEELQQLAGTERPNSVTSALGAVAVPADFTPDRTWPVLIVSASADPGYNFSSRRMLRVFLAPALAAGWIVIAADAPETRDADTGTRRYALILAVIERLQRQWPQLPAWPRAFGGFSGGAKRAASLAAMSTALGRRPIGVFQGGCNEPAMRYVKPRAQPARGQFLSVPVFLSGGTDDRIAPLDAVEDVGADLQRGGFAHVRVEHFGGEHEVHPPHVKEALRWFVKLAPKAPPAGAP